MTPLLVALPLILAQSPTVAKAANSDAAVWAEVTAAIRVFQSEWTAAWMATQNESPAYRGDGPRAPPRVLAAHCHFIDTPFAVADHLIRGEHRAHAQCPNWLPDDEQPLQDERRGLDYGIAQQHRVRIWALRADLRATLESAAGALPPGDLNIAMQRVRFALDAGADRDAWQAAAACSSDQARCALLRGLVLYRGGYTEDADQTFDYAAQMMTDAERCAWNDVAVLLPEKEQKFYKQLSCADRATYEALLWWLSDPLWLEHGNERRAEHFARKTQLMLLEQFPDDGRQHFEPEKGGDAVKEVLVRYGWPTQMYWPGPVHDNGHDGWLLSNSAETAAPYSVREYSRGRLHTVPTPAALHDPFKTRANQWQLNEPAKKGDWWWPEEHYARDASKIVQLPEGQQAMLLRGSSTRFLQAINVDRPVDAALFVARKVGDVDSVATFRTGSGTTLVVDQMMPVGPALIGIEFPGDSLQPAGRTRFAVDVARPLSMLQGQALSPPLLFDPAGTTTDSVNADVAVKHMLGSTTIKATSRLGVYWEGYRFTDKDFMSVALHVVRTDKPGLFARIGSSIGVVSNDRSGVAVQWQEEPGAMRALQVREGNTPVQMRSIVLDVSQLQKGRYLLTVSMTSAGGAPVTSERAFEIR